MPAKDQERKAWKTEVWETEALGQFWGNDVQGQRPRARRGTEARRTETEGPRCGAEARGTGTGARARGAGEGTEAWAEGAGKRRRDRCVGIPARTRRGTEVRRARSVGRGAGTGTEVQASVLGNNGFFITMTLYTAYPLIFMTRCLGLAFPLAVQILSATKIIDILCGFIQGSIIEKARMPWGKYRSWFLIGPVVAGVSTCLFFSPLLLHVPEQFVFGVAVFLLALWNVISSIVLTAFHRVLAQNRVHGIVGLDVFKLSNQLQAVTGTAAGFFMMKIVFAVGGTQNINLAGMQAIGVIYSLLYLILFLVFFANLKDYRDTADRDQRVNAAATMKLLFTNKQAAALTLSGMFSFSAETFLRVVVSFYSLYVLFSLKMLDAYNWTTVVAAFAGFFGDAPG